MHESTQGFAAGGPFDAMPMGSMLSAQADGMPAGDMNAAPQASEMPMGGMLAQVAEGMPMGSMLTQASGADADAGAGMPAGAMLVTESGGMPMGAMPSATAESWNMDLLAPQGCGCG